MKYVLLLLFFTTPPAPHLDVAKRKATSVWAYASSSTMEFATQDACEKNADIVIRGLDAVDTMTATGWCFCKAHAGTTCPEDMVKPVAKANDPNAGIPVQEKSLFSQKLKSSADQNRRLPPR